MNGDETLSQFYGLIRYLARSYYDKTLPKLKRVIEIDDLFMEGIVGAIKAMATFDEKKGPLTNWVTLKARGQILDSIIALSGIPKRKWKLRSKIRKAEEELSQMWDKNPSDTEIAEYTNMSVEDVKALRSWITDPMNIDDVTITAGERGPYEYQELIALSEAMNECIQSALTFEEGFVLVERIIYKLSARKISEIIKNKTAAVYGIEANAKKKLMGCLMNKGWSEDDLRDILD